MLFLLLLLFLNGPLHAYNLFVLFLNLAVFRIL